VWRGSRYFRTACVILSARVHARSREFDTLRCRHHRFDATAVRRLSAFLRCSQPPIQDGDRHSTDASLLAAIAVKAVRGRKQRRANEPTHRRSGASAHSPRTGNATHGPWADCHLRIHCQRPTSCANQTGPRQQVGGPRDRPLVGATDPPAWSVWKQTTFGFACITTWARKRHSVWRQPDLMGRQQPNRSGSKQLAPRSGACRASRSLVRPTSVPQPAQSFRLVLKSIAGCERWCCIAERDRFHATTRDRLAEFEIR
jgi:hypothetical protein